MVKTVEFKTLVNFNADFEYRNYYHKLSLNITLFTLHSSFFSYTHTIFLLSLFLLESNNGKYKAPNVDFQFHFHFNDDCWFEHHEQWQFNQPKRNWFEYNCLSLYGLWRACGMTNAKKKKNK